MPKENANPQEALKRKLRELMHETRNRDELRIESIADTLDQVISSADRELAVRRLEGNSRLLKDIREALQRINAGVYGICERCEQPVPERRLDAVPWARMCVKCQTEEEARQTAETALREAA